MSFVQYLDVNTSYYTSNIAKGGSDGDEFYFGLEPNLGPSSGTVVRSMQAWVNDDEIRGFQVELTNGKSTLFGTQKGNPTDKFVLANGEKITSLKVWGSNFSTDRSGGFAMVTNQNRMFNVTPKHRSGDAYEPELGSGVLVGVFGKSKTVIFALGFALLRRVERAQLSNVEYPGLPDEIQTKPKEIRTITFENTTGTEQQFTFEGSESVTSTSAWSVTAAMEIGIETTIQAGIPFISKAGVTVRVQLSVSGTYGREDSRTTERSFSFPLVVPSNHNVQATATLFEGNIDSSYTGDMSYTLDSGATFCYKAKGTYQGLSASGVDVKTVVFSK